MPRKKKETNSKQYTFVKFGLDVNKNLLEAPTDEETGEKVHIVCKTTDELINVMSNILIASDCESCAIFAVLLDANEYVVVKTKDDKGELTTMAYIHDQENNKVDYDVFKGMDDSRHFEKYGLLVEIASHEFAVVES